MRNESGQAYLPQSEERIVAQQMKNRSKLDAAYDARQQSGTPLEAQGGFRLDEAMQCTYIDLDWLIAACELTADMMHTLKQVMDGYSLRDIAEMNGRKLDAVEREFRNAVSLIVRKNNQLWMEKYARKYFANQK